MAQPPRPRGQDVWGATCTDASGNLVDVNDPTCVNHETQDSQANNTQNYVFTNDTPTNPGGV